MHVQVFLAIGCSCVPDKSQASITKTTIVGLIYALNISFHYLGFSSF